MHDQILAGEPTVQQLLLAKALPHLVLASASPARRSLLVNAGIEVTVCPTDADEQVDQASPSDIVQAIAGRKLQAYMQAPCPTLPVLTCDTMICHEGKMIGKPRDRQEAKLQLESFSGKGHEVYTGWALAFKTGSLQIAETGFSISIANDITYIWGYDKAQVVFFELPQKRIEEYLDTGEWQGAAGSYRIQGKGLSLIDHINGDYSTVVGLPISQISDIVSTTVHFS